MIFSERKVLTIDQATEYLGYSKSYIYKLTSAGILPFSKPNGKNIFFDKEKLEAWMLSNETVSNTVRKVQAATFLTTKPKKTK